jgi:hypothetical protein
LEAPNLCGDSLREIFRRLPQRRGNLRQMFLGQSLRSSRAVSFDQSGQAFLIIAPHPICHGAMGVSKKSGYLTAAHALCHKQDTVQPIKKHRLEAGATRFFLVF